MKHLVFVGAGHAHLHSLARTREFVRRGAAVTLIAPGRFWYSGMGPGMIARFYEPADDTVEVQRLVEKGGGQFVRAHVERIDPRGREVHLSNGERVSFDLLSLNVGSEVPIERIEGAAQNGIAVKPIRNLLHLRERLEKTSGARRVVVIGGGAAGSEIALNLWHLLEQLKRSKQITVISASERLLGEAPPKASRMLERYAGELGIRIAAKAKARRVVNDGGGLELDDGAMIPFDELIIATGIRAPRLLRDSKLPCADDGSTCVNEFLQSVSHPEIFGAGDCVWFGKNGLPRVGVYAVRQAAILHRNLLAFLEGKPLRKFRPQKNYLLILNLGDGSGLLMRGNVVIRSRWVFRLKNWLDRRFVRKFQKLA